MTKYLILAEKPSAAKKFAKALGAMSGTYNNESYKIVSSHGHLMTLAEPHDMLKNPELAEKYKSWKLEDLPWDANDFTWERTYAKTKNPRTKRLQSTKKDIAEIKKEAKDAEIFVIATDNDPSGEGELIGWEIINAINWKKKVARMYFEDESVKSIQKAFVNLKDIDQQFSDGDYLKAESRNRWDYLSMQLTRVSTTVARKKGYRVKSIRQGRLKSVMIRHIYEQNEEIKKYVKKPYYEVKFKDENDIVFSRKVDEEQARKIRYTDKKDSQAEANSYHASKITNIKKTRKTASPGMLLDLSGLAARLAPMGFNAKEVLATYQKLYEAEYVSYPRTEDKKVTIEQYNDLLPLVEKIANVVSVPTQLLTHRRPRAKHITKDAAHGANRPGLKVPSSLSSLSKFGKSAIKIYEILAKNYLAILAEDYIYENTTAQLLDYPDFKTSFNTPIELNFRAIFNYGEANDEPKKLGELANPFIYEGANKKPNKPSMKWLMKYLEKFNVGTGATRTSTLGELTTGTNAPLKETKGVYSITQIGEITAVLLENTYIASVKVTQRLFESMDQVGKFEMQPSQIISTSDITINHDLPIIIKNAEKLLAEVGQPQAPKKFTPKEKFTGTLPSGEEVSFNKSWGTHKFSETEAQKLLNGETITFKYKKSEISGSLQKQTFKGHEFWGFKKGE